MAEKNQLIAHDYSDNFSLKEFSHNELAEKYFGDIDRNKLNVGLIGYTTEQISNITEDTFNTVASLTLESFPNRALLEESIYSHAAIFQLADSVAVPSHCQFALMIKDTDVINYGTIVNGFYQIILDKDTKIKVKDRTFVLDYDIIIKAQKHFGNWIYAAQYDMTYENSISPLRSPYIKIRNFENGFIGLFIIARQFTREITPENIINNTKINFPVIEVEFQNQFAGFDVLYKSPSSDSYVQLKKRLMYTQPIKNPFCYYKMINENKIGITFTSKETMFHPEFNSDLQICIYTTNGKSGDFEEYKENEIIVVTTGEKYQNNDNLTCIAQLIGGSSGGVDKLGIEALKDLTIESYSTAKSITTENDLMMYFNNYKYRFGTDILVLKKRDDIVERLYSAFLIIKKEDYIYSTNTMFINLDDDEFDINIDDNMYILKPGHVFKYDGNSKDTLKIVHDVMAYDEFESDKTDFTYTNPFMMSIMKKNNLVGFYMAITNQTCQLDHFYINKDVFIQFVATKISIQRILERESKFDIELQIMSSITVEEILVDKIGSLDNKLKVLLSFKENDWEIGYVEMIPTEIFKDEGIYTFKITLETDDYITSGNKFRCLNATKTINNTNDYVYVPMMDCELNIHILLDNEIVGVSKSSNIFYNSDYANYTVCNIYSTYGDPVTFIRPMNMLRSTVKFSRTDSTNKMNVLLTDVPFIGRHELLDYGKFNDMIKLLTDQYVNIEAALETLTNNMHIDVKFYNTYGRSKNFVVGDTEELLDRVNITISFKISTLAGTDEYDLLKNIKLFIKEYIEKVNVRGTNDVYISNLIREIENKFPEVHHHRFISINEYDTEVQTIRNMTTDLSKLSKDERIHYVPELLVIDLDDISLQTYE